MAGAIVIPDLSDLICSVVTVGDGRGFEYEDANGCRVILTAAHCLSALPVCHPGSYTVERTFSKLLSELGADPWISAECLFVDPVADIAVLGQPDGDVFSEQYEAYGVLVGAGAPFLFGAAPKEVYVYPPPELHGEIERVGMRHAVSGKGLALVLGLEGQWLECTVGRFGMWLSVEDDGLISPGMSGSPIVDRAGLAIGVLSSRDMSPVIFETVPARILRPLRQVVLDTVSAEEEPDAPTSPNDRWSRRSGPRCTPFLSVLDRIEARSLGRC
jgi:hypothetical protein